MKFLQENGFDPKVQNAEELLASFREEMTRGLAGEGSLPMIPSGFSICERVPRCCEIPVFDVGGTNIRSARIRFDENGVPEVLNLLHGYMPGSRGAVDHETFYTLLCDTLLPNVRPGERIGYCFSYPVDGAGKLLYWTKGIQATAIVGSNVVRDLEQALDARGVPGCSVCVLNDTVAALLAAYAHVEAEPRAGYVGFILGTGTNTAYAERGAKIKKIKELSPDALYPINCESGNFSRFTLSRFDERHEAHTGNGRALWERCISGVHLGPLGTEILHAAAEENLFAPGLCEALRNRAFTNVELDSFCAGKNPELLPCSASEAEEIRALICPMYERAARFASINIAATALHSAEARGVRGGTLRINADGSTFWKTACVPFIELVQEQLEALLAPRGFAAEIVHIDDAPLLGAALCASR